MAIATAVRRYKSAHNLPLGRAVARLQLASGDAARRETLRAAGPDLLSITRAQRLEIAAGLDADVTAVLTEGPAAAGLAMA